MKATITTNWITKETELTQEQYDALFPKKKIGRWKPEHGEEYWYISSTKPKYTTFFANNVYDEKAVATGNCYQTKELAQKAFDRQLAIVRVNDRIDELNDGWEMVWDLRAMAYTIVYSNSRKEFETDDFICYSIPSVIKYLSTKQIAEQIIEEMEADLRLIFNIT